MQVQLSPAETFQAAMCGVMRQAENLRAGRKDAHGAQQERGWQLHIEGALGECAAAKALDIYWSGKGTLRHPDVGNLQVRTSSRQDGDLILHPNDPDDAVFVHVVGGNGNYDVRGWVYGREGKRQEYWRDPAGGRPAYFVPQAALHPLEELEVR